MRTKPAAVLAIVAVLALPACTSVSTPIPDMPRAIAEAKTADDHRRIADYFAQEAASYDAEAAFHDKMFRSYYGARYGFSGSVAGHCRSLQEGFSKAAKEARALEQAHRQLADEIAGSTGY